MAGVVSAWDVRAGVFGPSIHSSITGARTCFDGRDRRSDSSCCIDGQNEFIGALSWLEVIRLIGLSGPASRSRCPEQPARVLDCPCPHVRPATGRDRACSGDARLANCRRASGGPPVCDHTESAPRTPTPHESTDHHKPLRTGGGPCQIVSMSFRSATTRLSTGRLCHSSSPDWDTVTTQQPPP